METGLPGYLKQLDEKLAASKASGKPESEIKEIEELLQAGRNFLKQKKALRKTYPNMTFSDVITLYQGGREIQIRHARAITAGDAYIYLAQQGVVITGDILLSPCLLPAGAVSSRKFGSSSSRIAWQQSCER